MKLIILNKADEKAAEKEEYPKKEDFDNEFDYWKAYRKWQAKNGKGSFTKKKCKSILCIPVELKKAKYTRKYRGPSGKWIYKYDDGRKRKGRDITAPQFAGDWDNKAQLMGYMRTQRGKQISVGNRTFKIGQKVAIVGDPSVGMNEYNGYIVASAGKEYVMVYDSEEKTFDEVRENQIIE
jgi:hypothetical protein